MNEIDLIHFYEHGEVVVACGRLLTESSIQIISNDDLVIYNLIGMTKQLPLVDVVVVGLLENDNSIRVADIFPILLDASFEKTSTGKKSAVVIDNSFLGTRFVTVETGLGPVYLAIFAPADVQESPRVGYEIACAPIFKIANGRSVFDNTMVLNIPFYKRKSAPVFLLDDKPRYFPEEKKIRASGHQVGYPYNKKKIVNS